MRCIATSLQLFNRLIDEVELTGPDQALRALYQATKLSEKSLAVNLNIIGHAQTFLVSSARDTRHPAGLIYIQIFTKHYGQFRA